VVAVKKWVVVLLVAAVGVAAAACKPPGAARPSPRVASPTARIETSPSTSQPEPTGPVAYVGGDSGSECCGFFSVAGGILVQSLLFLVCHGREQGFLRNERRIQRLVPMDLGVVILDLGVITVHPLVRHVVLLHRNDARYDQ
jgi:hypothetical protein